MIWTIAGVIGAILLTAGIGYVWWDARKKREAWRSRQPLYCWSPPGHERFGPDEMLIMTTKPPNESMGEEEEGDSDRDH